MDRTLMDLHSQVLFLDLVLQAKAISVGLVLSGIFREDLLNQDISLDF